MAQVLGYTVVDASSVAATYLDTLMYRHAKDLLGRPEVQQLLDKLGADNKPLVDEVVPKLVSTMNLVRILQSLLDEEVSIRDLRTILDCLAEHADGQNTDIELLTSVVRVSLGGAITQQWFQSSEELQMIGLDQTLEQSLIHAVTTGGALEPSLAQHVLEQTQAALEYQDQNDYPPVLIVTSPLRPLISRFIRRKMRNLAVMSLSEIPDDRSIRITTFIGATR
jgi:flagellar biosynthesis protein FlhA